MKLKKDEEVRSVKIYDSTHTKLKIFIARNKISMTDFISEAVNEKINNFKKQSL